MFNPVRGNNAEMVTIPKSEYDELVDRDLILSALEQGGVDNWDWYGASMELAEKWRNGDTNATIQ